MVLQLLLLDLLLLLVGWLCWRGHRFGALAYHTHSCRYCFIIFWWRLNGSDLKFILYLIYKHKVWIIWSLSNGQSLITVWMRACANCRQFGYTSTSSLSSSYSVYRFTLFCFIFFFFLYDLLVIFEKEFREKTKKENRIPHIHVGFFWYRYSRWLE